MNETVGAGYHTWSVGCADRDCKPAQAKIWLIYRAIGSLGQFWDSTDPKHMVKHMVNRQQTVDWRDYLAPNGPSKSREVRSNGRSKSWFEFDGTGAL